ncbi:MAG: hypothetical protein R3F60_33360 [bacterium]
MFALFGLDKDDPTDMALVVDCLREMLSEAHAHAGTARSAGGGSASAPGRWLRESLRGRGPGIILTTGGMCDGRPVRAHLADRLRDERTVVLLTGYCGPRDRQWALAAARRPAPSGARSRLAPSV